MRALTVDAGLMEHFVETLGQIGQHPDGGLFRPAYSSAALAARDQVAAWLVEAGLEVRIDAMGSLYGRLAGREAGPAIVSGSHIDTVRQGGKLDGALGVLAALMAARVLKEQRGQPRRSIEVVAFPEEEGSRFPSANYLASRAITGMLTRGELDRICDADGVSIAEAMRSAKLDPDRLAQARRDDIAAFIELHIEQGQVLESKGLSVGVVHTIAGGWWEQVDVSGRPDHAGGTPMALRQDAMVAAAEMILAVTHTVEEQGPPAVATVGSLTARPGAPNIIPGHVTFTIDARHTTVAGVEEMERRIAAALAGVAERRGRPYRRAKLLEKRCVPLHPEMISLIEAAAKELEIPTLTMPSGAGHDAQIMATRFPTGMIFVMSEAGRSHCPDEHTPIEHVVKGVQVLASTLEQLAY